MQQMARFLKTMQEIMKTQMGSLASEMAIKTDVNLQEMKEAIRSNREEIKKE
jgi:hypothetical protein